MKRRLTSILLALALLLGTLPGALASDGESQGDLQAASQVSPVVSQAPEDQTPADPAPEPETVPSPDQTVPEPEAGPAASAPASEEETIPQEQPEQTQDAEDQEPKDQEPETESEEDRTPVETPLQLYPKYLDETPLRREFYYATEEYARRYYRYELYVWPDSTYIGHPVYCTEKEKRWIVNTLYHEFGQDKAGCILVAQVIRDTLDYNRSVTDLESCIRDCFLPDYLRADGLNLDDPAYASAVAAYEYVFVQGNSAFPHKLLSYMGDWLDPNVTFGTDCYIAIGYYCGIGVRGLFWFWDVGGGYVRPGSPLDLYLDTLGLSLRDVPGYKKALPASAYLTDDTIPATMGDLCRYFGLDRDDDTPLTYGDFRSFILWSCGLLQAQYPDYADRIACLEDTAWLSYSARQKLASNPEATMSRTMLNILAGRAERMYWNLISVDLGTYSGFKDALRKLFPEDVYQAEVHEDLVKEWYARQKKPDLPRTVEMLRVLREFEDTPQWLRRWESLS